MEASEPLAPPTLAAGPMPEMGEEDCLEDVRGVRSDAMRALCAADGPRPTALERMANGRALEIAETLGGAE